MIEIKNLYKRYHNHHGSDWVLRDINLTIPTGVSVGLIGANGAGKSTLLRLIAGMDTPERGQVIRHSRVSWPIGLTGGMQGSMTGRQNVKFVARAQGKRKKISQVVDFVENFAEIGKAFDEPVKTYSSGMRSRLSFGLSLAFDFNIYLSDEATAVGDKAFKKKANDLFKEKVNASSLIMVSHSEGILREMCQSGIYIKNGMAIWYDSIHDALDDYDKDVTSNNLASMNKSENQKALALKIKRYNHYKSILDSLCYYDCIVSHDKNNFLLRKLINIWSCKVKIVEEELGEMQDELDRKNSPVIKSFNKIIRSLELSIEAADDVELKSSIREELKRVKGHSYMKK